MEGHLTFLLCYVMHGGQGACAVEQPGACWEILIHDHLIHGLELPLGTQ